jgi:ABC-type bacteriocin/lantibiotic exporter with double-glycine peptidase domain
MENSADGARPQSKTGRVVTVLFGVFLVVIAAVILAFADWPLSIRALVASLVFGLLGIDACVSAARSKRSLVERIGPLP